MNVTLVVPTLNEIEGMREIMPRVHPEWCSQVIVVDGGSKDGTVEFARQHGYIVHEQQRKGLRHAYREILPLIRGDIVITFSPDGNSIPELLPALIQKMSEGFDMVIVSRYLDGARSEDDDWLTGFGNWFITKTINFLYGAKYTDSIVMYRAYKTKLIYDLELDRDEAYLTPERLFKTDISWEPLLSVRAAKRRLRVTEIPGDEPPRIGGERKLQFWRWGAAYYYQFARELFCWR